MEFIVAGIAGVAVLLIVLGIGWDTESDHALAVDRDSDDDIQYLPATR